MSYLIAYEDVDRRTATPAGGAHAVAIGDGIAACGRTMMIFTSDPWPVSIRRLPASRKPCGTCAQAVYG